MLEELWAYPRPRDETFAAPEPAPPMPDGIAPHHHNTVTTPSREARGSANARGALGVSSPTRRDLCRHRAGTSHAGQNRTAPSQRDHNAITGGKGVGECSRSFGRILAHATRPLPPQSRHLPCRTESHRTFTTRSQRHHGRRGGRRMLEELWAYPRPRDETFAATEPAPPIPNGIAPHHHNAIVAQAHRAEIVPARSSHATTSAARSSGRLAAESTTISGCNGSSYGSSMPVNPLISPARAFL